MIFQTPSPVAFYIFNLPVYWYGIIMALAVAVAVFCAELSATNNKIRSNFFIDNSPFMIIAGLLGARFYYCLLNLNYYINNPTEIFDIRQGGLSIHGMLFVGVIYISVLCKIKKIPTLKILDISACAVILAQSIGRWGNFFNSEAFGKPTYADWGVFIPKGLRPDEFINCEFFHPTFLYESLLDFLIFLILFFVLKKQKHNGITFFTYLILYSLARILVEAIRIDSVFYLLGIPVAQVISFLLILVGLYGLICIHKKSN